MPFQPLTFERECRRGEWAAYTWRRREFVVCVVTGECGVWRRGFKRSKQHQYYHQQHPRERRLNIMYQLTAGEKGLGRRCDGERDVALETSQRYAHMASRSGAAGGGREEMSLMGAFLHSGSERTTRGGVACRTMSAPCMLVFVGEPPLQDSTALSLLFAETVEESTNQKAWASQGANAMHADKRLYARVHFGC